MATLICLAAIVLFLSSAMAGAWAAATRTGNSGFVNSTWSLAVGIACVAAALWPLQTTDITQRQWLVAFMALAWSARLATHIFRRSLRADDDPRYADLKREWGADAPRRLFLFLQAQAIAGWPLAGAAFLAAHAARPELGALDALGATVFVAGLAGEAVADRQMTAFRANPANRGGICEAGFWAYSRHPNYFCEWLCWVAYAIIAADFTGEQPWSWLALAAPITMYWLLVHVSGLPPLEAHLAQSRPEAFADYRSRVSAFWPRPPAKRK